jgi:hypothetical protein
MFTPAACRTPLHARNRTPCTAATGDFEEPVADAGTEIAELVAAGIHPIPVYITLIADFHEDASAAGIPWRAT